MILAVLYGAGVGVGAKTLVVPVPKAALFERSASDQGWPGVITAPTLTANSCAPTFVQLTDQERFSPTTTLAGRIRSGTMIGLLARTMQSGGTVSANVTFARMLGAGPLLWKLAIAETRNGCPVVALARGFTATEAVLTSVPGIGVGVGTGVGEGEGEGEGDGDGEGVGDGVGVGDGDGVGVGEGVAVGRGVGVAAAVRTGVGVGVR
jgi:hypothetical protein